MVASSPLPSPLADSTVQYPSRRILPDALRDLDCHPCSPAERTALASINEQCTHNFTCASRSEYSTTVVCPPFMTPSPHMFDAVDFLTWRLRRECQKTTRTRTRTSTLCSSTFYSSRSFDRIGVPHLACCTTSAPVHSSHAASGVPESLAIKGQEDGGRH